MATTGNNLRIPDALLKEAALMAERQGRSADDVAAEALKVYLANQKLDDLVSYGRDRAKAMGLDTLSEEEQAEYIDRVIHEFRREEAAPK